MKRLLAGGVCLGILGLVAIAALAGTLAAPAPPSAAARAVVPDAYLRLYEAAATTCPGLSWALLAAIGTVESSNGQSTSPGVRNGANFAGAEGPMQFEPATFAAYAVTGPGGQSPPSPYDPTDAVYTAARYLCANGAGNPQTEANAVFAYNHSQSYVDEVLGLAASFSDSGAAGDAASAAVSFAESSLGVPYLWGGTGRGGFDCSGLAQAAYASAGVSIPRVAQEQYDAGPRVPPGVALEPGDLVFFGDSSGDITHVGLYIGDGLMIDAPHTGAAVRAESADWPDFVGATRPTA